MLGRLVMLEPAQGLLLERICAGQQISVERLKVAEALAPHLERVFSRADDVIAKLLVRMAVVLGSGDPYGSAMSIAAGDPLRRRSARFVQPPPKRKVASSTLAWGTTAEPQVRSAKAPLTCGFVILAPMLNRAATCRTGVNDAL